MVTLVYLSIQVRQNTAALRSTATQGAHDQTAALYDLLSSDPELAEVFARGLMSPDALDQSETARFFALSMGFMFRYQNWYLQTRSNLIDRELLDSWAKVLGQLSATPGYQQFWKQRRHVFAPEFVKYLERKVFSSQLDPTYRPLGISPKAL